ncbi:zona pellucida sperm-binding protein 4-like [Genypterus blacodes]|uniref:zona pellucida sperm-binding protein 4-like n=1 Tax=Genypterus blacodes TaxID=154954 RepID=UPI003F770B2F
MAGLRVALLPVLAGTLLLVSVRGWTLDPNDLLKLQSGEEWEHPFPSTDDVVEGEATEVATSDSHPFGGHDFEVQPQTLAAPTAAMPPPTTTTMTTVPTTTTAPKMTMPVTTLAPSGIAQNCHVPLAQRLPCGPSGISSADCSNMGCCVGMAPSACYYPVNECTADRHFVFSIRHDSASIPVDLSKLIVPGHPKCKPLIVASKVAIFKFKITECGVTTYEVGNTQIYLAEVQTRVRTLNLKYGFITRTDPLRYLIECRYGKMGSNLLASVGYMVKRPSSSMPSTIVGMGRYGVELRIAKDSSYLSFYSTYYLPLRLLLGKPLYLELRLKSPTPDAVILVNYCVAYPRSASNALVLTYEGCANPNDPNVSVLKVVDLPQNRKQRRFMVKAFQFMDQRTNAYLDEEIYFMCSSEVCRTSEKSCAERCFDGKVL